MYSSGHVDWLAVTFPAHTQPNHTMPQSLRAFTWVKKGKAANGYLTRMENELGAWLLTNGDERQGIHLVMPGEALSNSRSTGVTDRQLCQYVTENNGTLTRLDVAIDIMEGKLTAGELAKAYAEGCLKTPAKGATHVKRILEPDETFYLGSRSSERFFRAYNKGAQVGILDMNWLRLELELKKVRANGVAHAIAGEQNTRSVINRAIGDYVTMPGNNEFNSVLSDKSGPMSQEGRKLHSTYKWLMEIVAPAMARYQADHMTEDVWQAFLTVYTHELNRLIGSQLKVGEEEISNPDK